MKKSTLYSVGEGSPVYLVAEAGATHVGLDSAKALVDIAMEAKFDAVKFQMVELTDSTRLIGDRLLDDILQQRILKGSEWVELVNYCKGEIELFATAERKEHIDMLYVLGNHTVKICSEDLTNLNLITLASEKFDIVQIDTGHSTIHQVEAAVKIITTNDSMPIIHHCEDRQLGMIDVYKQLYQCPVAFSVHGGKDVIDMNLMALAFGADLLEVPIKEDDSESISPEAAYALDYEKSVFFVQHIREMEKVL